eukprot:SAG22_NODE_4683_length_1192_cov_96.827266_1_plen_75_part_10
MAAPLTPKRPGYQPRDGKLGYEVGSKQGDLQIPNIGEKTAEKLCQIKVLNNLQLVGLYFTCDCNDEQFREVIEKR